MTNLINQEVMILDNSVEIETKSLVSFIGNPFNVKQGTLSVLIRETNNQTSVETGSFIIGVTKREPFYCFVIV